MSKTIADLPLVEGLSSIAYESSNYSSLLARQAQEHGPIFKWTVSMPGSLVDGEDRVTMVGPEANRFVMHTHRDHFSHELGWTPILGEAFGKGLLNMDDPSHARHRKMWNPAFTGAYMGAYLPIMQRVIEENTATWVERDEVDLAHEAREITFDIAARALAGFEDNAQVTRLRGHFYELLHGFDENRETIDDYVARMEVMQAEMIGMLLSMIRERRQTPLEDRPQDVLAMIVHARDDDGQPLSDEQVLAHLMILLVAGHETTTTLAAWTLYLLATLPEHRVRIEAELESVLGDGVNGLSMESIRGMKALDNLVREAGRLYPPVVNVPRVAVKEFEFAGYTIPENTIIRLSLGGCHRLPDIFKDPDTFDPDRFAPPREEDKKTPYALVTFGGGPRVCIGQHFAHVEVKALVAHVLPRYRIEPRTGHVPVHAGFFNAFIINGVPVRVSNR
jgi:cytochrome P450